MTDPVQLLIDAGAIPELAVRAAEPLQRRARSRCCTGRAGEPGVAYVRRRFIPAPVTSRSRRSHRGRHSDRPDLLAATYLGDPLLYWRIADANAVVDPNELTDTLGAAHRDPAATGL